MATVMMRRWPDDVQQTPHDGGLARAVGADHAEDGAPFDTEADAWRPNALLRESTLMAWAAVFPGSGGMAPMVGRGGRGGLGSYAPVRRAGGDWVPDGGVTWMCQQRNAGDKAGPLAYR